MKNSLGPKIFLISAMAALVLLFFILDLDRYFSFDYLKTALDEVKGYYGQNRVLTMAAYMGIYILVTALSLPGAAVMTLAGGALFGLFYGTLLVSFASTLGATLAFLFSRYVFRELVQKNWGPSLRPSTGELKQKAGFISSPFGWCPCSPFF